MEKHTSIAWGPSILTLAIAWWTAGLQGQTKPSTATANSKAGAILVDTDDSCRLVLDGQYEGVVKPDESKKVAVAIGEHILKCTVEGIPDLAWRKVVDVKDSNQVAILVSLKIAHIQYAEATAQLEKSNANSQYMQATALIRDRRFLEALPLMTRACDAGNPAACTDEGKIEISLATKPETKEDFTRELTLFRKGCDNGDPRGCTELARQFQLSTARGFGAAVKLDDLILLERKGCYGGDAHGCTMLAVSLLAVEPRDPALIIDVENRGCAGSDPMACESLGERYALGVDTPANQATAKTFYLKAAALYKDECEAGEGISCVFLASLYKYGKGVPENAAEADRYDRKACSLKKLFCKNQ